VADRRAALLARLSWLGPKLNSGDQFVACTCGKLGRMFRWQWQALRVSRRLVVPLAALSLYEVATGSSLLAIPLVALLLHLLLEFAGRGVLWSRTCVAVTRSELCVIRMPFSRAQLPRFTIRTPLRSVFATVESNAWYGTRVRLVGPDFPPQGVLFHVSGWPWREDLDRVLAALSAATADGHDYDGGSEPPHTSASPWRLP
jgi:hypothetical protein